MVLYTSRATCKYSVGYIVPLNQSNDDYGLYLKRFRNDFGTPLGARGTLQELIDLTRRD